MEITICLGNIVGNHELNAFVIPFNMLLLQRQPTTNGVGKAKVMKTIICKVVAQGEPVYVPSKKAESGQIAKTMIRLKMLGGDYEDEYICGMYGNLALCRFAEGVVVAASLRFMTHESNGNYYQDIVANDIVKL